MRVALGREDRNRVRSALHDGLRAVGRLDRVTVIGGDAVDQLAVRIDVSPLGYPWVLNDAGVVYIWTGKTFRLIPQPRLANDIAVGVNGKTMVSIKTGGTAIWTGAGWTQDRSKEKLTNIAVDNRNDPWGTTARNQIWAMR